MKSVSVKELKNRATQIICEVREGGEDYQITVDGELVTVLRLATQEDKEKRQQAGWDEFFAAIDELGAKIAAAWNSPLSAAEAVAGQRRELQPDRSLRSLAGWR